MTHLSLFSGIGGIDIAAHWAGFETVAFCEFAEFPRELLSKRWPGVPIFNDITKLTADGLRERGVEWPTLITGGFPCQPFSAAGKRRGTDDDRHLWPQMLRVIEEIRPTWVVGENVAGLVSMVQFAKTFPVDDQGAAIGTVGTVDDRTGRGILDEIVEALESAGYEVQPIVIPACAVGALHQRARLFILAHTERGGCEAWSAATRRQAGTSPDGLRESGRREDVANTAIQQTHGVGRDRQLGRESLGRESLGRDQQAALEDDGQTDNDSIGRCNKDVSDDAEPRIGELPESEGREQTADADGDCEGVADTNGPGLQGHGRLDECEHEWLTWSGSRSLDSIWFTEPPVGRVAHGVSRRVDRLKGLGNAVVPQQIYPIFEGIAAIIQAEAAR